MRRGELYWANLAPRSGSEQTRRPVVIVSHNGFNQTATWRSIIVVPISTSSRQNRRGPTTVQIPQGVGGVTQDSVALCHQVTALDRAKLLAPSLGELPPTYLDAVEKGLRAALNL
jgi:mRNA interferase MazF